ncbi:tRNA glutamyl-Q(34) synthetase GluQRS [Halomonas sp. MCCC 1A17488]|uniref:tRNA glutamyl-Q(34) synthetase GluQRS n=1 Tax=unclassified Halomonas TaxID=2609666 RepID=UPI0018D22907|nr:MULTISPECIES: tRNA glutamyl-Q(34) synthetase GluQRS [unclassified Halomonas]MCE8017500.1 tRNA glutamyl-Q(34) synthetase GluQRS [Halomonas sp. MCCC 1A17488]MCG3240833.1 tRNA glutamyl-Q(34) synthetase GluQRS [Halomonas sp. MCCC 1A17488]QPP49336.1 tRNA glutamyl-Q(34) synthetase GluQRS [Halomonas sp. SS10-MC5]
MTGYRGRFAPTPSGALHFGSLIAALASFLDARRAGGEWLLRIEDIDPPRCPAGAADTILRQLEAFGLNWDGPVLWQHDRDPAYADALERLKARGLAYACSCSRKQWRDHPIYPGWCRDGVREPGKPVAWRLRSDLGLRPVTWQDRLFGEQRFDPAALGDVVLQRKDGLWAYQLAVVVDDADQGISDVVRGYDLLDNTPWQRQLQHALGLPEPRYLHLPLIVNREGQKLSKQNLAPALPLEDSEVRPLLHRALTALDQAPPAELNTAAAHEQLDWAITRWEPNRIHPEAQRRE